MRESLLGGRGGGWFPDGQNMTNFSAVGGEGEGVLPVCVISWSQTLDHVSIQLSTKMN